MPLEIPTVILKFESLTKDLSNSEIVVQLKAERERLQKELSDIHTDSEEIKDIDKILAHLEKI